MSRLTPSLASGVCLGASLMIAAACSASGGTPGAGNGSGGTPGGGGVGGVGVGGVPVGTGAETGSGASGSFGMGGASVPFGGSSFGGSSSGEEEEQNCGTGTYRGESVPLDIFIMMDRSSSMVGVGGADVWAPITQAITNFVNLPEAAGIGVGINFFPPLDLAQECNVGLYATPVVPVALLPGNAAAITNAFQTHAALPFPFGFTPTRPAMEGARDFARQWQAGNPGKKVVVVLVTDGEPNNCDSNIPSVAAVAADLLGGSPSISTYVIGIGNVNGLNQIAMAGGTTEALIVPADPNVATQQFLLAMNTIRGLALPCDYTLPEGENADPEKVNLDFTANGMTERIPYVSDLGNCANHPRGWYFDNPNTPTRVIACPETCSYFSTTMGGEVNLVVGCKREDIK